MSPELGTGRPYYVRSVQTDGAHLVILLDTPNGYEARIDANLRNANLFEGLYTEHLGPSGRLTATRR